MSEPPPAADAPGPPVRAGSGLAIASLAVAVVGLLLVGFFGLSFFFGVVGAILGGFALARKEDRKLAIAGLVVSGVALVSPVLVLVLAVLMWHD